MGQEASSRSVKNLSAALAARDVALPVRNVLHWPVKCRDCRSLARALGAEGWIGAEKNAYRCRIPLISELSGSVSRAEGMKGGRQNVGRAEVADWNILGGSLSARKILSFRLGGEGTGVKVIGVI